VAKVSYVREKRLGLTGLGLTTRSRFKKHHGNIFVVKKHHGNTSAKTKQKPLNLRNKKAEKKKS